VDDQGPQKNGHDHIGRESQRQQGNKGGLGRGIVGGFGRGHPFDQAGPEFLGTIRVMGLFGKFEEWAQAETTKLITIKTIQVNLPFEISIFTLQKIKNINVF
jgi:hypothetical protein